MPLNSSIGNFLTAANKKADQLTAGAKIALCLPSFLTALSPQALLGRVFSTVAGLAESIVSTVSNIVLDTINSAVSQITGAFLSTLNSLTSALGQIGSAIQQVKGFYDGLKNRVTDINKFVSDKQNCDFAAAQLMNCIVSQALNSVTPKIAVDISKGTVPVQKFASEISQAVAAPGGAINRAVNKTASEIDRATRVIQKSSLL